MMRPCALRRDMLYVLSVFACTTASFASTRWSWRAWSPAEKECAFQHWMDIGRQMSLRVDEHWHGFEDCLAWKRRYEARHTRFAASNHAVIIATVEHFLGTLPCWLRRPARALLLQSVAGLQESPLFVEALGLSQPSWLVMLALDGLLTARAWFVRHMLPPRPLALLVRLTGDAHCEAQEPQCPFHKYALTKPLDFGNTMYKDDGYIVQHMGPRALQKGLLLEKPRYKHDDVQDVEDEARQSMMPR
jgi:hypothetical protein